MRCERYARNFHAVESTAALGLIVVTLLGSGCASDRVQAQWTDARFAGRSLSGEYVLVVCDADAVALCRLCEEQVSARLTAMGVIPVTPPDSDTAVGGGASSARDNGLATARTAGAKAVFASTLARDTTVVDPGPTFGIGVGGGGGYHGGIGGGVGVSVPVGSERANTAYGADMSLTDVATGKLMWSGKVTTRASADVAEQIGKLAQTGVAAAQKAGVL
jgi:hypothetical protein